MSLLTEKQIVEIIDMATQQDEFARILKLKFDSWNKNQPDQFAPDWDRIPNKVIEVQLKMNWLNPDTGDCYYDPCLLKIYKRSLRAHPHAEIMMKYAEVAARRIDPWVEFEWFDDCLGDWIVFKETSPMFSFPKIRHIGETK